jgi:membrane protein implicated in regulation of membrane protease activity
MAIGATAALAAWKLAHPRSRHSFMVWQALGILDLVLAVGLGTMAPLLSPHSTSMAAMTVLPLSLVPTFLVPLFLIFHVICIAQARSWKSAPNTAHWQTSSRKHGHRAEGSFCP